MGSSYGNITQFENSAGLVAIPVASTATVYTKAIKLSYGQYFGVWVLAASSGTVNLKIQIEQSAVAPAAEGSSDANYVIGDGVADIYSALADTTAHVKTISPVPMKYARLKITGGTGNDASTTVQCKLFSQEITGF